MNTEPIRSQKVILLNSSAQMGISLAQRFRKEQRYAASMVSTPLQRSVMSLQICSSCCRLNNIDHSHCAGAGQAIPPPTSSFTTETSITIATTSTPRHFTELRSHEISSHIVRLYGMACWRLIVTGLSLYSTLTRRNTFNTTRSLRHKMTPSPLLQCPIRRQAHQ